MSDTIPAKLCAALAKAQMTFVAPKKSKKVKVNNNFEYHYADLSDIIEAVRQPLAEQQLVYMHLMSPADGGTIVTTVLAHSSGESINSSRLIPHYQKQQEFGSAFTYTKRYQLAGLLGIVADEDEDANLADGKPAIVQPRGNGRVNGAGLPPHPEEPPEIGEDRKRIRALIDRLAERIKTAPDEHRLEVIMDDARDSDLKEIEASGPGGIDAGKTLRARYATKIALLRGGAPA